MPAMSGTLFIVPTPIGNLEDITQRATRVLAEVDVVASEDTRHSGILLKHLGIKKPLVSYEEHNEQRRIPELIDRLLQDQSVALISDAGTPALSDPGFKLIREAIRQGVTVDVLPGASSILVALVASGLPTDKFYFGGFLPRTSAKRIKAAEQVANLPATMIFFESPHRLGQALADLYQGLGNRPVCVARELTKIHQELWRGTLSEASEHFAKRNVKGEIVVVVGSSES